MYPTRHAGILFASIYRYNKYLQRAIQTSAALCLLLLLVNCGGGGGAGSPAGTTDGNDIDTAPHVVALQISPTVISLVTGTQTNGSATAIYSDNSKRDATEEVSWSVLSSEIATVSNVSGNKGVIQGRSQGSTQISASLGGIHATKVVTIEDADLVSLSINPQSTVLPSGTTISLQATGHYSNGTSQDITTLQWASSAPGIAAVDESGVVTGVGVGNAVISASFAGLNASAELSISDAILTGITINPTKLELASGTEVQIHALGQFSDGTFRDITQTVTWQTSDSQVASITNNSQQLVLRGDSTGNVDISATLNGVIAQKNIEVTDVIIESLAIVTEDSTIALGGSTQFTAIATFSDYSTQDLTEQVTWNSDEPSVLTVSNATGEAGLGTPLDTGTVTVSIGFEDLVATKTITVTDAQLLSINLAPINPSVAVGTQLQLTATGNYSDGTSREISAQVTWGSTKEGIASVGNAQSIYGLVDALTPGVATITALLDGIVGSTQVTVTDAVLESIEITPAPLSLARGTHAQLHVIGHFSDTSTQDLTRQVYWSSGNSDIVAISNLSDEQGYAQSVAPGVTTISVQLISDESFQSAISVTVTDATLQSISIAPENAQISNNTTLQYTATGHFSDGSTQDLTEEVTWDSSDTQLVTISNVKNSGLAKGVSSSVSDSGNVTISARISIDNDVVENTTGLTADYIPDKPIAIVTTALPNVILNDGVDETTIAIDVKAAAQGFVVPDSTIVDLTITQGNAFLSADSVTTVNGEAQISLTSDTEGFIVITATVRGSSVSNHTVIFSATSFADVFGEFAIAVVRVEGTTLLADSRLAYFVFNFSNREFNLNEFTAYVDGVVGYNDPTTLLIKGGQIYGRGVIFDQNVDAAAISLEFSLNEPISSSDFPLTAIFTLQ